MNSNGAAENILLTTAELNALLERAVARGIEKYIESIAPKATQKVFSIAEAKQLMNVSRRTVERRIEAGELSVTKNGRRTLIQRKSIEKFI